MILRRFGFCLTLALSLMSFKAEAYLQALSPQSFQALYSLAASGNVTAINQARSRGLNVDSVNGNGDTGLCVAARRHDRAAYKAFLQSGANPSHPCTWEIDGYRDFMQSVVTNPVRNMDTAVASNFAKTAGMSWTTKALIGAGIVAAGAGTAVALGGGGGGGGGSKKDPNCVHGHWENAVCVCNTGYAGEKCNECAAGYGNYGTNLCYKTLPCEHGHQEAGACVCNRGYAGTLCDVCGNGYGRDSSGVCVRKKNEDVMGNPDINSNYNEAGNVSLSNTDYTDMYGLFYDSDKTPHNYLLDQSKFANSYQLLETVKKTVTEYEYDYDDDDHKIWYDIDGVTPKGYVIGATAYNLNDESVGHVIDDVVFDVNSQKIGDVLKTPKEVQKDFLVLDYTSNIDLTNKSDGTVYGLYSNNADTIYNIYVKTDGSGTLVKNLSSGGAGYAKATITVNNQGDGDVYGIFGAKDIYAGEADLSGAADDSPMAQLYSEIMVNNKGNGNAYGIYNGGSGGSIHNQDKTGDHYYVTSKTTVRNTSGNGNTYGLYGLGTIENSGLVSSTADAGNAYGLYTKGGTINNVKDISETSLVYSVTAESATGNVYGAYVEDGTMTNGRVIWAKTTGGTGNAYGIYVTQSEGKTATLNNTSGLEVESVGGDAYGIYNKGGTVTNSTQYYTINVTSNTGTAYGIYSDGGSVTNSGRIWVTGPSKAKAYGIYATNGAKVTNNGHFQFRINNIELNWEDSVVYTPTGCLTPDGGYAIYLTNGATFVNNGTLSAPKALSLGSKGVSLGANGQFSAPAISGNLNVLSDVVANGFDDVYTISNAIDSEDTTGLHLSSESVMFDVALSGKDVVLSKKDFADVIENRSVASFLEKNYREQTGEALFADLKAKASLKEVQHAMHDLTGQGVLSRFANEDMIMQKELDFDLNDKMFELKGGEFSFSGDVTPKVFAGKGSNTRYALSGTNVGQGHFGVGLAISDVRSDDGHLKNRRQSKNFALLMPYELKQKGFEMIFSPRIAYLYGSYDRDGYQAKSYDGHIEKRMAGVSNEVRYPFEISGFKITPAMEANLAAYQTKLKEDARQYSLSASRQNTYSAELGFGAYVSKEKEMGKNHQLKLMAGAMVYHEFGKPYDMELKMNGMNGSFKISDEKRRDDYVVLRSKLSYDVGDVSIYSGFLSYVDSEYRSRVDVGLKYRF